MPAPPDSTRVSEIQAQGDGFLGVRDVERQGLVGLEHVTLPKSRNSHTYHLDAEHRFAGAIDPSSLLARVRIRVDPAEHGGRLLGLGSLAFAPALGPGEPERDDDGKCGCGCRHVVKPAINEGDRCDAYGVA